jgi:hypothetical protein
MLPYYRKFQTMSQPSEDIKQQLVIDYLRKEPGGTNGPVQATFPLTLNPVHKAWIETFQDLYLKNKADPLSGHAPWRFDNYQSYIRRY